MAFNDKALHVPVLVNEVVELLNVKENGTYLDATVGLGGHSLEILKRMGSKGTLVGIDRDLEALANARVNLGNERVILQQGNFSDLSAVIHSLKLDSLDGVLFDLGVSMLQLKKHERGFSFMSDARLDMRMDPSQTLSAWDVINRYPEKELQRVLLEYGEEPLYRKIAKRIVACRKSASIDTCAELADIVVQAYGGRGKIHPATKTFQAIRIEVNEELSQLRNGLTAALGILKTGGRLCVISYHSLEDRIVKNLLREWGKEGSIKVLTKKPVAPSVDEKFKNPACRSAKLRGGEKQ
ncbi:MAG TPA: 16S rRNA (cytosine(1402)-N(4))-methyltransferase RsmH [Dissulfurispiraceae bacterium]|nr:16S rRNA (cytosine(1402)-N(4))-methyltransferase RsmH [Dissulfurispiraceae bacterium]